MNIGILTYHNALNYGGVLQAYALYKTVHDMVDYACVIDYHAPTKRKIKFRYNNPIGYFINKKTEKKFQKFMEKFIQLSTPCYSHDALKEVEQHLDIVLVGSDQIWNRKLAGFDEAFFLNFVKEDKKKKSYAASFGCNRIDKETENICKKYLSSFSTISVREKSAANIVCDITGIMPSVDLDPVLLLEVTAWEDILEKSERKDNYILIYMVGKNDELFPFAKKLSIEKKCDKVQWLSDSMRIIPGVKQLRAQSPEQFVAAFKNAKYVVTNSFHGTAFSILFHRKFFVDIKNNGNYNFRVTNLLDLLQLPENIVDIPVNWSKIDHLLSKSRSKSLQYLQDILQVVNHAYE